MKKFKHALAIGRIIRYSMVLMVFVGTCLAYAEGADAAATAAAGETVTAAVSPSLYYAIAVTMSCGCLASAFAVGKIGAAVMGAAAEKPEVLGKAIVFVGLGEGIALFGFLISMFLVFTI